ncbi:MAG TPA: hypothetical protein VN376_02050, partial [Longilinea sp.]|nr:hypothetical protein [Longilinea sp.]
FNTHMDKNYLLNKALINWLLQSNPWTAYRTRLDLLHQAESDPAVSAARIEMFTHPLVAGLTNEIQTWPGDAITNHKNAGLLLHKLVFLADLGLKVTDTPIKAALTHLLAYRSSDGPLQVIVNIPTHFGGSGQNTLGWILCDTPSLTYSLAVMGLKDDPVILSAVDHLAGLVRPNGFPCTGSPEIGRFRGPGKKEDPCPIANLIMLKLLIQYPDRLNSPVVLSTADTILNLWEHSQQQHPYLFQMGTDFRKLKAPLVWYDLLHCLDVLTQIPSIRMDPRLLDMLAVLTDQANELGQFTPTSIWTAWKEWDFGLKKQPSPWVTFLAWRIVTRMNPA